MMEIDIEFTESFYNKFGNPTYVEECISETIEFTVEKIVEACKEECPVRTGTLRDGHYHRLDNLSAYVGNNVEYAPYVIYGTSKQSANNYPQRAINRMGSSTMSSRFHDSLITRGVIG